jgi:hypothetical protein
MAWFADLTKYTYGSKDPEPNTVNIGWLDIEHPYPQGETSVEFQDRLTRFCEYPPEQFVTYGFHPCEFCGKVRGGNEIRIIAENKTYAAPVLVFHYVVAHAYRPPDEFIEAVMNAPAPSSHEVVSRYGSPRRHWFPVQEQDSRPPQLILAGKKIDHGTYLMKLTSVTDPSRFANLLINCKVSYRVRLLRGDTVWEFCAAYEEEVVLQRLRALPCTFLLSSYELVAIGNALLQEGIAAFDYRPKSTFKNYDWRAQNNKAEDLGPQWEENPMGFESPSKYKGRGLF